MSDIYGRSVSRWQPGVTFEMVKKLIRDGIAKLTGAEMKKTVQESIAETLNLTEVDPDEIVVFAEQQTGKLKTSNVSVNDILTRQKNALLGSIAAFTSDGKLEPSNFLVADITKQNKRFNDYITISTNRDTLVDLSFGTKLNYTPNLDRIRRFVNVVDRFFCKDPRPDDIKTTLADIQKDLN